MVLWRHTFVAGLAVPVLGMLLYARAQNYPDRPIKFPIPLEAGSAVGVLVGDKMDRILGQRVFVEPAIVRSEYQRSGDLVRAANIRMD